MTIAKQIKKLLLFLSIITSVFANNLYAQVISSTNYIFSTNNTSSLGLDLNGNVADTTFPGIINSGGGAAPVWADNGCSAVTMLPFDFYFMGKRFTQFTITADGMLNLGNPGNNNENWGGFSLTSAGVSGLTPRFSAFGADLFCGRAVSISTIGISPNRCSILDWNSMALFRSFNGSSVNNSRFQIRLYEATGIIEFVYGSMHMNNTDFPPAYIGFATSTTPAPGNIACINSSTNTLQSTSTLTDNLNGGSYSIGPIANLHSPTEGARRQYQLTPIPTAAPTVLNFTNLTINGSSASYTLNWIDNSTEEIGYVIYKSSDGINYSYVTTTAPDVSSFAATGLTTGNTYYWRIFALKESLSQILTGSKMAAIPSFTSFFPPYVCDSTIAEITIEGTFLSAASSVTLNGEPMQIISNTSTRIVAKTDASPQQGYIQITTPIGPITSVTEFIVKKRPFVDAGANQAIVDCNTPLQITGASSANCTYSYWESDRSGYFNNNHLNNPIYIPGSTDFLYDTVTLKFTGVGFVYCFPDAHSTKKLSLPPRSTNLAGTAGGAPICKTEDCNYGALFMDANCNPFAALLQLNYSSSPVYGEVDVCVTIDPTVQTTSAGQPYLQRHFNIYPNNDPDNTEGKLRLYCRQSEFDAYNLVRGPYPAMPTGPNDWAGRYSIRVTKFGGTGTLPGNYTGAASLIESFVSTTWNGNYWEIEFDSWGFGGFYIHTNILDRPLPVNWLGFSGIKNGEVNELKWTTAQEINNEGYDVQRSLDGISYKSIGFVKTKALGGNSQILLNYDFTDLNPESGTNYYRLKQIDLDGKFTFSNVLPIKGGKATAFKLISVYPNPAKNIASVLILSPVNEKVNVRIVDMYGKTLLTKSVDLHANENMTIPIDISPFSVGTYMVLVDGKMGVQKLIKY